MCMSCTVAGFVEVLRHEFWDVTCSGKEVVVSQRLSVLSHGGECSWYIEWLGWRTGL
jgi:hypothetical protein